MIDARAPPLERVVGEKVFPAHVGTGDPDRPLRSILDEIVLALRRQKREQFQSGPSATGRLRRNSGDQRGSS